jgi:hypothetical protein
MFSMSQSVMGKKSRNTGDYAHIWRHIKYSVLIRSSADYIVYIDRDGDLDWQTTTRYDNSVARNRGYDHSAMNSTLTDAAILEVTTKHDSGRHAWETRRATLVGLLRKTGPGIRLSEHLNGDGATIFRHACALGAEGIVGKRRDRPYRSGRCADWIKVRKPDAPAATRIMEWE